MNVAPAQADKKPIGCPTHTHTHTNIRKITSLKRRKKQPPTSIRHPRISAPSSHWASPQSKLIQTCDSLHWSRDIFPATSSLYLCVCVCVCVCENAATYTCEEAAGSASGTATLVDINPPLFDFVAVVPSGGAPADVAANNRYPVL